MSVITFAGFVVVTQNTFTCDDKDETVLVQVLRAMKRRRQLPHDDLSERTFGVGNAFSDELDGLHSESVPSPAVVVKMYNGRRILRGLPRTAASGVVVDVQMIGKDGAHPLAETSSTRHIVRTETPAWFALSRRRQ